MASAVDLSGIRLFSPETGLSPPLESSTCSIYSERKSPLKTKELARLRKSFVSLEISFCSGRRQKLASVPEIGWLAEQHGP